MDDDIENDVGDDIWTAAMARGDFERAWQESDRVLRSRDPATRDDPSLPFHERWVWDGRAVDGRAVLVRCYHGLGDTLQFCRYLPALRRRARHVTLEAQPALLPLLATLPGIDRLVGFDPARPLPPGPCDLEIMELAHALRLRPEPAPYLAVAGDRRPGRGLRVGLSWRAGASWRLDRSLPDEVAAGLLRVPGVAWVSLQRGAALPGLADDCPAEILETARRIAGLDLVVAVDTMIAHLAGALGVGLCLLLSDTVDWRWRAGGDGSVWYRGVRKYRQTRDGDWAPALAALASDLTRRTHEGTLPFDVSF